MNKELRSFFMAVLNIEELTGVVMRGSVCSVRTSANHRPGESKAVGRQPKCDQQASLSGRSFSDTDCIKRFFDWNPDVAEQPRRNPLPPSLTFLRTALHGARTFGLFQGTPENLFHQQPCILAE